MPTIRGADTGSKKRYAGMIQEAMPSAWCLRGWKRCVPTGRRWPSSFNRSYTCASSATSRIRIMCGDYRQLMNGELDEQLVYRKRLRRPLAGISATYRRTCAARLADEHNLKLGRAQRYQQRGTIKYVWTTSGPEPVDYQQSPLDYDHYLTKQLQPVAEGSCPSSTMTLLQ
nr:hypothetical protein [Klebsiella pneumoniae subsp. pneumoniae]